MTYFFIIFSFLFESVFSNIVNINSIFIPLFLITTLVILYPYFKNKKINFIVVCIISGLLYDISFADSIFVNTISFCIIGLFIILAYDYISYNICSSNFLNVIILILYRFISYVFLCLVHYISFNETNLIKGIYSSIIINIIYGIIIFIIVDLVAKIFNIKRID